MDVSEEVQKRIECFLQCKKPKGWHHAAKIHRFAPYIMALVEEHKASFAEIAFYLRTKFRVRFSRQRLHAYYQRIDALISELEVQNVSLTSDPTFKLPSFSAALQRLRDMRVRAYWRLRTPLLDYISELTGLRDGYLYTFAELSEHLKTYYSLGYSRQAICQFLQRHSRPSENLGVINFWGAAGKV
ncbi:hypothetical protein AB9X29_003775 [Vibrio vulnificus]